MMSIRNPNGKFFTVIYAIAHSRVRHQLRMCMGNTADGICPKKTRYVQVRTCRKDSVKKAAKIFFSKGANCTPTSSDSGEVQ